MCLKKIFCCFESTPLNETSEEGEKNDGFDQIAAEEVKISQAPDDAEKIEENPLQNQRASFKEKDLPADPSQTATSLYYAETINDGKKE